MNTENGFFQDKSSRPGFEQSIRSLLKEHIISFARAVTVKGFARTADKMHMETKQMLFYSLFSVSMFFCYPAFSAELAPQSFTLDGTLLAADHVSPLSDPGAKIKIQILNPLKTCVLYEEEQLANPSSSGHFNVQVGSAVGASKRRALDSGNAMARVYQNSSAIPAQAAPSQTCAGSLYTPVAGDVRYVRVIVTPTSSSPETLTPDMVLDSVPNAVVAQSLQGVEKAGFLQVNSTALLTQAKLEQFMQTLTTVPGMGVTYDGTNFQSYDPKNGSLLSSGSVTDTQISDVEWSKVTSVPPAIAAVAGLSCTNGEILKFVSGAWACGTESGVGAENDPTVETYAKHAPGAGLVVNGSNQLVPDFGTTAGKVAQGNDPRFTDSRAPSGGASGDLSGSYPNPTVAKLQGRGVSVTAPADGQVLKYDNGTSTWVPSNFGIADLKKSNGLSQFVSASCTSSQTLIWSSITDDFSCTNISLPVGQVTGTLPIAQGGTGETTASAALNALLPAQSGQGGKFLQTDGTSASWSPAAGGSDNLGNHTATQNLNLAIYKLVGNGGTSGVSISSGGNVGVGMAPSANALDVAGTINATAMTINGVPVGTATGITSINGSSQSSQTFATPGTTGTAPNWSTNTGTGAHTLNIPMASTASVTAGLIAKTDYDNFNGKIGSSYSLAGDVTGTPAATVVDRIKGKSVSAAPTLAGQVLRYDGTNITPNFISMFDLRSTVTGTQAFAAGCTAAQTLTWTSATDNLACTNIAITGAAVSGNIAGNAANVTGTVAIANGGTGQTTANAAFNALAPSQTSNSGKFLTTNGTNTSWTTALTSESDPKVGANTTNYLSKWSGSALVASGVIESGGSVGIGTVNPTSALDVVGVATIGPGAPTSGSTILRSRYGTNETLNILGTEYSSGGTIIGYGVTPSTSVSGGFLSGASNASLGRSALTLSGDGFSFKTGASQTVAPGSAVSMAPVVTILNAGNVGIGTTTPVAKLDVSGEVKFGNTSSACNSTNEGQQRYNSIGKEMEFCNGSSWTAYGSAAGAVVLGTSAIMSPLVADGLVTAAHGLGVNPTSVRWYFECISANNGYAVGDRIHSTVDGNSSSLDKGFSIITDSTNIYIATTASPPFVVNKASGGVRVNLGAFMSSWRLVAIPVK